MFLRQIQYFQAVVEHNNFTEAAESCHISQSAISQQVKALEDELGVLLLERKGRGFLLTPAGSHFYQKSLILLSDLEQLKRETARIARGEAAELKLGYLTTYSGGEFQEAIASFAEKYPAVELTILQGTHEDLYTWLISGRIDLAFSDQRRVFYDRKKSLFHIVSVFRVVFGVGQTGRRFSVPVSVLFAELSARQNSTRPYLSPGC